LETKKNIETADERIPSDETIVYIAPTNANITSRNTNKPELRVGVIVITNKNIYISHSALWEKGQSVFSVAELELVSYKATGMGGARLELTLSNVTIDFLIGYGKRLAEQLYEDVNKLRMNKDDTMQQKTASSADELREYKLLLDDGIITQEEFEAKKKQLLGL